MNFPGYLLERLRLPVLPTPSRSLASEKPLAADMPGRLSASLSPDRRTAPCSRDSTVSPRSDTTNATAPVTVQERADGGATHQSLVPAAAVVRAMLQEKEKRLCPSRPDNDFQFTCRQRASGSSGAELCRAAKTVQPTAPPAGAGPRAGSLRSLFQCALRSALPLPLPLPPPPPPLY